MLALTRICEGWNISLEKRQQRVGQNTPAEKMQGTTKFWGKDWAKVSVLFMVQLLIKPSPREKISLVSGQSVYMLYSEGALGILHAADSRSCA